MINCLENIFALWTDCCIWKISFLPRIAKGFSNRDAAQCSRQSLWKDMSLFPVQPFYWTDPHGWKTFPLEPHRSLWTDSSRQRMSKGCLSSNFVYYSLIPPPSNLLFITNETFRLFNCRKVHAFVLVHVFLIQCRMLGNLSSLQSDWLVMSPDSKKFQIHSLFRLFVIAHLVQWLLLSYFKEQMCKWV